MRDSDARHDPAGLCAHCAHGRIVPGGRSVFHLCERSFTDPRYGKYPMLPLWSCPGYEQRESGGRADDKLKG